MGAALSRLEGGATSGVRLEGRRWAARDGGGTGGVRLEGGGTGGVRLEGTAGVVAGVLDFDGRGLFVSY
ncbi:MAG TPA: hypothetical protein VH599_09870 [Ktedonobacterales bacterium]